MDLLKETSLVTLSQKPYIWIHIFNRLKILIFPAAFDVDDWIFITLFHDILSTYEW